MDTTINENNKTADEKTNETTNKKTADKDNKSNDDYFSEQYQSLLLRYQEAVQNYIQSLESKTMIEQPERAWWGTAGISEHSATDKQTCQEMCETNPQCSGATFNDTKQYCWLRKGTAATSPANEEETAFIAASYYWLSKVQSINQQLQDLYAQWNRHMADDLIPLETEQQTNRTKLHNRLLQLQRVFQQHHNNTVLELKELDNLQEEQQLKENALSYHQIEYWIWCVCLLLLVLGIVGYSTCGWIALVGLTFLTAKTAVKTVKKYVQ